MPPVHVLRTVSVTTLLTLFVEKMTSHMTMPVKPIARKKNLIYFVHIYCSTVCNNRLNSINTEFDSEFFPTICTGIQRKNLGSSECGL